MTFVLLTKGAEKLKRCNYYTVNCNVDYEFIQVDKEEHAKKYALLQYRDRGADNISEMTLIPYSEVINIDLAGYDADIVQQKIAQQVAAVERDERAELARLKAKFEE